MSALHELQLGIRRAVLGHDASSIIAAILGDGLDPAARLAIHRHHLFASLTEALKATFPVVCRLVDARFFAFAAHEYIRANPPRQPCLHAYGDSFALFLAAFPACCDYPWIADVARLEWAINAAYHAEEAEPIDPAALAPMAAAGAAARFVLDPSLRHVASAWPIDRIWEANNVGEEPAAPVALEAGGAFLELRRIGDRVTFRRLDEADFTFRSALAGGETLEAASRAALALDPAYDLAHAIRCLIAERAIVDFTCPAPDIKESTP